MGSQGKYYFPQLDSIRGLSFLAVYLFHAVHPPFGEGFISRMLEYFYNSLALSIDVFFILSSFLLTWLGINEYKIKGNFSFINYFIRRVLRIWPLYFLLMLFSFVLLPYVAVRLNVPVTLPPAYYYLYFISNFYLEGHVYFLRFLWTLSVEEQFYLLWGICLLLFQKNIRECVVVFAATGTIYTIYAVYNKVPYDLNTLTYLFDFAVGILAAVILQRDNGMVTFFRKNEKHRSFLFMMSLPVLFILFFIAGDIGGISTKPYWDLAGRYVFIVFVGLFIIEQMVNEQTVLPLKKYNFLVYTGKISYGLYCFHGIVLTLGGWLFQRLNTTIPAAVSAGILLIVNYAAASFSYQFIEKPFLVLKNKMRRV